jgi:thiol-disulfide isomerase/thioredoxin
VRRRLKFTAVGCVLAALLAIGLFGPWDSSSTSDPKLPASLPSLFGGGRVVLPNLGTPRSDPVVITFFASWCGPCNSEIPAFARFADAEHAKGVKVQFIGVDENDPTGGRAFAKRSGISFAVGSDVEGIVLEDLQAVPALPQTLFINTEGVIVHHAYGSVISSGSAAGSVLAIWAKKIAAGSSSDSAGSG